MSRILCIDTEPALGILGDIPPEGYCTPGTQWRNFLNCCRPHFHPRADAETDESRLQIIPYVVAFAGLYPKSMLAYQRKGSERRLHGKWSIGFGGHIEDTDTTDPELSHPNSAMDAVYAAAAREAEEELSLNGSYILTPSGLVFDPSTSVGRVHLGIVMSLKLDRKDQVQPTEDECERFAWVVGRNQLMSVEVVGDGELENWSKLVLDILISI